MEVKDMQVKSISHADNNDTPALKKRQIHTYVDRGMETI
jgi:hypothetical protein